VAQIIREAECGFVVEPGDVDSFVKAVETLSHDHGLETARGSTLRLAKPRDLADSLRIGW